MELSVYLARAWGLGSVLTCVGLLLNQTSFISMMEHLQADSISILIAGILALGIGVSQVAVFNTWAADYRGLISLFGWVSLLKGIAIIFCAGLNGNICSCVHQGDLVHDISRAFPCRGRIFVLRGLCKTAGHRRFARSSPVRFPSRKRGQR